MCAEGPVDETEGLKLYSSCVHLTWRPIRTRLISTTSHLLALVLVHWLIIFTGDASLTVVKNFPWPLLWEASQSNEHHMTSACNVQIFFWLPFFFHHISKLYTGEEVGYNFAQRWKVKDGNLQHYSRFQCTCNKLHISLNCCNCTTPITFCMISFLYFITIVILHSQLKLTRSNWEVWKSKDGWAGW
jgi:hypothetical protein